MRETTGVKAFCSMNNLEVTQAISADDRWTIDLATSIGPSGVWSPEDANATIHVTAHAIPSLPRVLAALDSRNEAHAKTRRRDLGWGTWLNRRSAREAVELEAARLRAEAWDGEGHARRRGADVPPHAATGNGPGARRY